MKRWPPASLARATPPPLQRIYYCPITPVGQLRVKCLLDLGALHCLMSCVLSTQLPSSCLLPPPARHPPLVVQADDSLRPTGCVMAARLVLSCLEEEMAFVEFDVACDADLILLSDWLRAHGLRRLALRLR